MTTIKEAMIELNPWWKKTYSVEFKKRSIYSSISRFLSQPQIIALTGLRRVGKTTIMHKIIEDSIARTYPAQNIIYFSFDEFRTIHLRDILRTFEKTMNHDLKKNPCLFLFDEIQKVSDWENQLKAIYDVHGKQIKFIISGSESLFIRKKTKETLAGRIYTFQVNPLSFPEFLKFKDKNYEPVQLHEQELLRLFDEFILTLGFPELVSVSDRIIIRRYLQESLIEKILFQDLQTLVDVRDISVLDSLLRILLENPGQLIDLADLSSQLGITRQTLSLYIDYLKDAFLLKKLYNFSKNRRKVERKLKKYYPTIISPALLFRDDIISRSKVFEWLLVHQLDAEYFWRDPYKHEVDIVLGNEKPIPIEIKYESVDTEGTFVFMKKFDVKKGIILTYDTESNRRKDGLKIDIIPAYKYLLQQK